jgi:hypothetical protein
MFRAVAGIAVVTTIFLLSPERDSNKHAPTSTTGDSSLAARMNAWASGGAASVASQAAVSRVANAPETRAAVTALVERSLREDAAGSADTVRRIMIPPPPLPIEMPPLRR